MLQQLFHCTQLSRYILACSCSHVETGSIQRALHNSVKGEEAWAASKGPSHQDSSPGDLKLLKGSYCHRPFFDLELQGHASFRG